MQKVGAGATAAELNPAALIQSGLLRLDAFRRGTRRMVAAFGL